MFVHDDPEFATLVRLVARDRQMATGDEGNNDRGYRGNHFHWLLFRMALV
jgi:hypothetical protein